MKERHYGDIWISYSTIHLLLEAVQDILPVDSLLAATETPFQNHVGP